MKKVFTIMLVLMVGSFLVSCVDTSSTYTVEYVATKGGYISGKDIQEVVSGASCEVVKAIAEPFYHFVSWSDGSLSEKRTDLNINSDIKLTATFERDNYEFPSLYLDTNGVDIVSKDNYIKCLVSVDSVYDEDDFSNVSAKIKGRGNSTWGMPKKPYKLKFDEKIDLFGNGKAKTWTLIANYCDQSLVRNYLAYGLGRMFGDYIYATSTQFVELYLNNVYQGLYLVCEQVEVGKSRININDDLDTVNTGYLLELDYRIYDENAKMDYDYFEVDGIPYAIKDPDTEDELYTKEHLNYIKDYTTLAFNAVKSGSYSLASKYIDINSFVYTYIIYELFGNVDVKFSSWYLYKDTEGLLVSSPIWDFDITCGNIDYDDQAYNSNFLYAKTYNAWYKYLLKMPEFKTLVKNALINNYYEINNYLDSTIIKLKKSKSYFEKNFTKWPILGVYVWPNSKDMVNIKTWNGQVEYVRKWLNSKLNYMYDQYLERSI